MTKESKNPGFSDGIHSVDNLTDGFTQSVEDRVSTPKFWKTLSSDVEKFICASDNPANSTSLEKFLTSFYDSDVNVFPYHPFTEAFDKAGKKSPVRVFAQYLISGYSSSADNEELSAALQDARRLLIHFDHAGSKDLVRRRIFDHPKFWLGFEKILASADPEQKKLIPYFWEISNKLSNDPRENFQDFTLRRELMETSIYFNNRYIFPYEENEALVPGSPPVYRFFAYAPLSVKQLLQVKFPNEFPPATLGEIESAIGIKESSREFLELISRLRQHEIAEIIGVLAEVLDGSAAREGKELVDGRNRSFLKRIIEFYQAKPSELQLSLESIIGVRIAMKNFLSDASFQDAEKVDGIFTEKCFFPLFKQLVYKDAAAFFITNPGPEAMREYLAWLFEEKAQSLIGDSFTLEGHQFLQEKVFPSVQTFFEKLASFAQEISVKGTKPYLHQVEAIRWLIHNNGGILADEPGVGKTISALYAAIEISKHQEKPGIIVVVGSISACNNWEDEIKKHIDTSEEIRILNLAVMKGGYNESRIGVRKKAIDKIEAEKTLTTVVFVNYDFFRLARSAFDNTPINVVIVDEAHNVPVKQETLLAIDGNNTSGSKVAKRTVDLHELLRLRVGRDNIAVIFLSGTPFVKGYSEIYGMAACIRPGEYPLGGKIPQTAQKAHEIFSDIAMARRAGELLNLPHLSTRRVAVRLDILHDAMRDEFLEKRDEIIRNSENPTQMFYRLLAHECSTIYPWLLAYVRAKVRNGEQVVVFTPFASRYTNTEEIAVGAIQENLGQVGISRTGILSGQTDPATQQQVQEKFRRHELDVIVGTYATAGEAITLVSPKNKASNVVIFVPPPRISQLVQAFHRVHRIGQRNPVEVSIPVVTGGSELFGRRTYNEIIFEVLNKDWKTAIHVIHGAPFPERDAYQIANASNLRASPKLYVHRR